MRIFNGKIAGDNCLPDHFRMIISGPTGSGKTTYVESLLRSKRIRKKFTRIYYCYPDDFDEPPVDWGEWEDVMVTFVPYMPGKDFFKSVEKDSLVVFDDNFDQAIKNPAISQAMRVHSRRRFSVILITQMFYEKGQYSRVIRNQCSALVLFRNFGDIMINSTIARQLGVSRQFKLAEEATKDLKYQPIVILNNEIVDIPEMRVQTNYLSDQPYCYL